MKKVVFCIGLSLSALSADAQWDDLTFPHDGVTVGEKVRLRKTPSVKGELVAELPLAAYVQVLSESSFSERLLKDDHSYNWVQVRTADGKEGWIYGKYLSPLWEYGDQCAVRINGECYDWYSADSEYSEYIDVEKSNLPDMTAGSDFHLLRSQSNPKKLYPIRNQSTANPTHATDGYWCTPEPCCAMIEEVVEHKMENGAWLVNWRTGGGDDSEVHRYTIRYKNGGFAIEGDKVLEKTYYDEAADDMKTIRYND